ncbi:MAG: hypothetical protein KDH89_20770 [Anaerolineae bacterium]|nr:hypothetical protein [Anaerolineae bacterium]
MNKTSISSADQPDLDEMLPEYDLDYSKAKPNRFAGKIDKSQVVVMLEPDIAEVFTTPESVNSVLRALISTMPARPVKPAEASSPAP